MDNELKDARRSCLYLSMHFYFIFFCILARVSTCRLVHAGVMLHLVFSMHPTHIGGLSDEPLLRVEDMLDASDQLQRTVVIRALKDREHMCSVKAC